MTCIDNLFDWILEVIFLKLTFRDRLICKEICKRWNNLLMERAIFRNDRRIFLDTKRANEASLSVLLKAKPYQIYVVYGENIENLMPLFNHVGPHIEELYFGSHFEKVVYHHHDFDILSTMSSLKVLRLQSSFHITEMFATFLRNNSNLFFNQLKKLEIDYYKDKILENVDIIKEFIPQNCYMSIYRLDLTLGEEESENLQLNNIKRHFEVNNINCNEFTLTYSSRSTDSQFLKNTNLPYSLLESLENKHQNIKNINLISNTLPSVPINLHKLTNLELNITTDLIHSSLKPLEQLTNLNTLNIRYSYIDERRCVFGHESITLPKLETLFFSVVHKSAVCSECINALANSFENLQKANLWMNCKFSWNKFKPFFDKWKCLKSINLRTRNREFEIEDNFDLNFEPNTHLRSIEISGITNLPMKVIEKLSEAFPNLKALKFDSVHEHLYIPEFLNVIKVLVPAFTKLTHFSFEYNSFYFDEFDLGLNFEHNNIFEYFDSIGLPIENKECHNENSKINKKLGIFLRINRENRTSNLKCETENCEKCKKFRFFHFWWVN